MSMPRQGTPIDPDGFINQLMRLKRGSVSRRHFLKATGLGFACLLIGGDRTAVAPANAGSLGKSVSIATWPNYHDPATFEQFSQQHDVAVKVEIIGSNEVMMQRMQTQTAAWDLIVPTQYALAPYAGLGLIEPLDLAALPNFDPAANPERYLAPAMFRTRLHAVPKNTGTTGIAYNRRKLDEVTSWRGFFDTAMGDASGRTIVQDYQLTTIGGALVALGYPFNSIDPDALSKAEELLMQVKPHLLAIDSDYQSAMRAGDAWLSMCWSNDAAQLVRDMEEIRYSLGSDGGEIWTDYYAIPAGAQNRPAAYALLNHLMDPKIAAADLLVNGGATTDSRVFKLLPEEIVSNKVIYPEEASLSALEYAVAIVLTDPNRAAVMARFKAA
ncbi:spermidine/putrescine ABC transporter substrate-binding protein [Rhizobium sp. 18065]|uniref:ABC transporter substrate-binding protein n=1 Tax=Rhizobium sp. 18065 TaxID=2681411 RepID=UPI001FCE3922|nr:spermidine/putrescine ABC transporter substrate-binding protein [Rhizobium sp. 18065]